MPRHTPRVREVGVTPDMMDLNRQLEDLLLKDQRDQRPGPGLVQCPVCGVSLLPTKNKRVRVHDNPLKARRCEASKKPWSAFRKRPERPGAKKRSGRTKRP